MRINNYVKSSCGFVEKPTLRLWTGRGKQTTVFHPPPTGFVTTSTFPQLHSYDDGFLISLKTEKAKNKHCKK